MENKESNTSNIFMSTNGNDETGDGSISNPYLSLKSANKRLKKEILSI